MLRIHEIFSQYSVRRLSESDIPLILNLMEGNPQFYAYCDAQSTPEDIVRDMTLLPPGKSPCDKYYVGLFSDTRLVAVLDLIDGYPDDRTAFIGFFMMNREVQGKGTGSAIITELCLYLQRAGFARVHLAIDPDNPQSNHFWKKNRFEIVREAMTESPQQQTVLLAERILKKSERSEYI